MEASDSLSRTLGMDFFIPFPFPNFGNGFFSFPSRSRILGMGFFHSLPIPEIWEWIFLFPSRSRISGMGFFNSLPVPEPSKVIPAHPWLGSEDSPKNKHWFLMKLHYSAKNQPKLSQYLEKTVFAKGMCGEIRAGGGGGGRWPPGWGWRYAEDLFKHWAWYYDRWLATLMCFGQAFQELYLWMIRVCLNLVLSRSLGSERSKAALKLTNWCSFICLRIIYKARWWAFHWGVWGEKRSPLWRRLRISRFPNPIFQKKIEWGSRLELRLG